MPRRIVCLLLLCSCTELPSANLTAVSTDDDAAPQAVTEETDDSESLEVLPPLAGESLFSATATLGGDGRTESIVSDVQGDAFRLAVRVTDPNPIPAVSFCYQLEDVKDARGQILVEATDSSSDFGRVCTACTQRVRVGNGYGFYVFPNNGFPLSIASPLSFRVSVRDCTTLLPAETSFGDPLPQAVLVEVATGALPENAQNPTLNLAIVHTEGSLLRGSESEEWVSLAVQAAETELASMPIALKVLKTISVQAAPAAVAYSTADTSPLDAVYRAARAHLAFDTAQQGTVVPVFFVACLKETDALSGQSSAPSAVTPRIPGGGQTQRYADGIFLSTATCAGNTVQPLYTDPKSIGRILAHELGHYLGLYHAVESDGTTDRLDDTGADNLMYYRPSLVSASGVSPLQIEVMRRHPSLRY